MAFVGNLLWFVFGGFAAWLVWILVGIVFAITIVGIPYAYTAFRIARFAAFPFGKDLVDAELVGEKRVTGSGFMNFLWIILAGFWLALAHALLGVAYCITIIGIPWGIASFRLAKASFAPLGKRVVSSDLAAEARSRAAKSDLDKRLSTQAQK